ncbi:MAG TPA: carbon storage regulator [Gemmataceae bacterium]|jgi:carbon storage regulator CsrA|nr:carbon storage regulator [Gemmataceae bacterium]
MLVLSRRKGERIVLPECGVSLQVLAIGNKTIRLGISAPAAIKVQRKELGARPQRSPTSPQAPG